MDINYSSLASPRATRAVLQEHGLSAKYSLGQNFLVNEAILNKIINLAEVRASDMLLEVGPGIGTLTRALLAQGCRVLSVERDTDLKDVLAQTCAPWSDAFALISKDAVRLKHEDLDKALYVLGAVDDKPNKLVANLPYAVAATIVLDYMQHFECLESATVMVQKEVAQRMMAQPGSKSYGAYTVKLHLCATPVSTFWVGPNSFYPPPRVQSAVIRLNAYKPLDPTGRPLGEDELESAALMAEAAFANRRKTLANSVKIFFTSKGSDGKSVAKEMPGLFRRVGIDSGRRGETLTVQEFICLGRAYRELKA